MHCWARRKPQPLWCSGEDLLAPHSAKNR